MDYLQVLEDIKERETLKIKLAQFEIKLCKLKEKVYKLIFALSINKKYAQQIAENVDFDNFLSCGEFFEEEKQKIKPIIREYKQLLKNIIEPKLH